MELDRNNTKRILFIVAFGVVLFWILLNLAKVFDLLGTVVGLLTPFLVGLALAFIMKVPMKRIEHLFESIHTKREHKGFRRAIRPLSIAITLLLILLIVFFILFLVIPDVAKTIVLLRDHIPEFVQQIQDWWSKYEQHLPTISNWISGLDINWEKYMETIADYLQKGAVGIVNATVTLTTSLFSGIISFILGFIFAVYLLMQKEKLAVQCKKLLYAFVPEKYADEAVRIARVSDRAFANFISGQCTEAVILGCLCFIGMMIFRFPFALTISVLVGFTALIPIFGAFIGTAIGAFLIFVTDPLSALWFILFILVLQQIEGNLIYPKVVGTSVGLPSLWVLLAVTVGGTSMGIFGMLINVPIASVLYILLSEVTASRLKKRGIPKSKIENRREHRITASISSPPGREPKKKK
mgnify:CR=1 FL=1